MQKTYRPLPEYAGVEVAFPNQLTDETVEIKSWPYTTESSVEMAALDAHPWLTDGSASDEGKSLSKMNKAELLDYAAKHKVPVTEDMTKAQILKAIKVHEEHESEPSGEDEEGGE